MITVFLLGIQTVHAGLFSSSPSHKEEGRQEILNKLKDDINKELKKRSKFGLTYRKKNPQYEQQKPVLEALLNRADKLLEELKKDDADYLNRRKEDQHARTLKRIREVELQIELIKHHRMNTGEVYG